MIPIIIDEVKLIQVILCTKKRAGKGDTELDPIRVVTEIFDTEGDLIADTDPERIYTKKDVISFYWFAARKENEEQRNDMQGLLDKWDKLRNLKYD